MHEQNKQDDTRQIPKWALLILIHIVSPISIKSMLYQRTQLRANETKQSKSRIIRASMWIYGDRRFSTQKMQVEICVHLIGKFKITGEIEDMSEGERELKESYKEEIDRT